MGVDPSSTSTPAAHPVTAAAAAGRAHISTGTAISSVAASADPGKQQQQQQASSSSTDTLKRVRPSDETAKVSLGPMNRPFIWSSCVHI